MTSSPPESAAELKARALRLLARREHTRSELTRKLAPHAASGEAIETLLDGLVEKRQLSEARYAEERVRVLARKYGASRIRHELKAKGVAGEIAEGVDIPGERERAAVILARKYRTPAATREERARRARFLQGRGFSYDTIRAVLSSEDLD